MMYRMYDIITKKKNGQPLTEGEIRFFVEGCTKGDIPHEQASALCMAICLKGMTMEETAVLTDAMMRSGDTVDLSHFGDLSVDKHSTGGVGDKTTLIVAPLVASLGGKVAKMSGRGLGHTGGTVDKLESIPGYRTDLSPAEFADISRGVGVCVVGQSGDLAPADKKLYALRDVTATVDSIPLIASSIMSKKLAGGAKSIVLDVKCGSGAFMKTLEDATALADAMVAVGKACGRNVCALITDMDVPLGTCIGNALEVEEAIRVLRGEQKDDLYRVCIALASHMLSLCKGLSVEEAAAECESALNDGRAFDKLVEWVAAQGGDPSVLCDSSLLPKAKVAKALCAPQDGYISHMDTGGIGTAACLLGAGRTKKEDPIDPAAGIRLCAKTGDYVKKGDPMAILYTNDGSLLPRAEKRFVDSLTFSDTPIPAQPLILSQRS